MIPPGKRAAQPLGVKKERVAADSAEFKAGRLRGRWGGREWESSISRNGMN